MLCIRIRYLLSTVRGRYYQARQFVQLHVICFSLFQILPLYSQSHFFISGNSICGIIKYMQGYRIQLDITISFSFSLLLIFFERKITFAILLQHMHHRTYFITIINTYRNHKKVFNKCKHTFK